MSRWMSLVFMAVAVPAAAWGEDRETCPSLAGLDTGPCVLSKGEFTFEINALDVTHDKDADERQTIRTFGQSLLRHGVDGTTEVQLGWTPEGHARTVERATRRVSRQDRVGDITLGLRHNFRNPDGEGDVSVAIQPSVTLPVGRRPIGAGDWGAALIVPVSFAFTRQLHLTLDPEADAAVDEDGHGRHLSYGGVVSLEWDVSDAFQLQADYSGFRDRDPSGHATEHRGAVSATWLTGRRTALWVTGVRGLDHDAVTTEWLFGVARRF